MFGIDEKPKSDGQKLDPIVKYDIQCMSIGLAEANTYVGVDQWLQVQLKLLLKSELEDLDL